MMEAVPRWRRALLAGGLAAMALLLLLLGTAHHGTRVTGDLPLPLPWRPAGGSGAAGATPLHRLHDVPTARRRLAGAAAAAEPAAPPRPAAASGCYFVGYAEDEAAWKAPPGCDDDDDDDGDYAVADDADGQQRRRLLGRRRYTAVRGSPSARARGVVGAGGVGAGRVARRNTVRGAAAAKDAKKMALVQAATLSKAAELAIKQFGNLGAHVRQRANDLPQRRRRQLLAAA